LSRHQAAAGAGLRADDADEMYKSYAAVAPKDEFPRLLDTMGAYIKQKYDWSAEILSLKMPVMLIYADSDMIPPEHIVKFYQLLASESGNGAASRQGIPDPRLG